MTKGLYLNKHAFLGSAWLELSCARLLQHDNSESPVSVAQSGRASSTPVRSLYLNPPAIDMTLCLPVCLPGVCLSLFDAAELWEEAGSLIT